MDPHQRNRLPEVGEMVKCVAAVDDVDGVALVLVGEQAGLDALDVGSAADRDLGPKASQHDGRNVGGDDPTTERRDRQRELSGTRTDVEHGRLDVQAETLQQANLDFGLGVFLLVIASDVFRIEILPSGVSDLIQHPAPVFCSRHDLRAAREWAGEAQLVAVRVVDVKVALAPRCVGR